MKDDRENWFVYYMAHGLDGALVGFIVSGLFVTVLYYPYFWINFAMTVALNGIAKSGAFEQNNDMVFGLKTLTAQAAFSIGVLSHLKRLRLKKSAFVLMYHRVLPISKGRSHIRAARNVRFPRYLPTANRLPHR